MEKHIATRPEMFKYFGSMASSQEQVNDEQRVVVDPRIKGTDFEFGRF